VRWRELVMQFLTNVALAAAGWIVAGLHLVIFDPWFLRLGKAEKL